MPNKNGTWPKGEWSGTGRGMWRCWNKKIKLSLNLGKKNGQWIGQWRWNWNWWKKCCN